MHSAHRSLFLVLLSAALICSLMTNVLLFMQTKQYYLQINEVRLDPLGLTYFPVPFAASKAVSEKKRVLYFGDSRAANWPPILELECLDFINRGIDAQTSSQALLRFEEHAVPVQADVILIQVGINDLKTIPLFPDRRDSIISMTENNIRQLVAWGSETGAEIILTTIFPVGRVPLQRSIFWSPDVAQSVTKVNSYIRSLVSPEVKIFDAYELLADEQGLLREEFAQDELHINQTGYAMLNAHLGKILANIGCGGLK